MKDKKYKDFIRKNFNPSSKEFAVMPPKKEFKFRKNVLLRRIEFSISILIIIVGVFIINLYNLDDKAKFNNVKYDYGKNSYTDDDYSNTLIEKVSVDIYFLYETYNVELGDEILKNYEYEITCQMYVLDNSILQCDLNLHNDSVNITIGISNNQFPLFSNEGADMWEYQENFSDLLVSDISKNKIILLKDSNNYKTKFDLNKIKWAVESYNIPEKSFIKLIKLIIKSNSNKS